MHPNLLMTVFIASIFIFGCGAEETTKKKRKSTSTTSTTKKEEDPEHKSKPEPVITTIRSTKAEIRKQIEEDLDEEGMSEITWVITDILELYDEKRFADGDMFLNDSQAFGAKNLVRDGILLYRKMCKKGMK